MPLLATQVTNDVETPSAKLKAFSNTPQPKPDGRQSRGVTLISGLADAPQDLASEAGLMKVKKAPRSGIRRFSIHNI